MSNSEIEQQKANALSAIADALEQIAHTYSKMALGTASWGSLTELQSYTGFSETSIKRLLATGERSGGTQGWIEGVHYNKGDQQSYKNFCYNIAKILKDAETNYGQQNSI